MGVLERFLLTDRVAIVTGAGRGIGAAIAHTFADAGADVVITSRTKDELEAVAAGVRATGRRAVVVPCDVSETENLAALVDRAMTELGRIDVVVNNVGGTFPRPFLDTSERMFERAFHFNVTTAFTLSRLAAPHLLAGDGGSIVNIGSAIGRLRDRGFIAYGTAKAAMAHMTRLMAADLAPRVRVNAIAVGSVATSALETVLHDDAIRDEMVAKTPLRRLGQPDDIALGALWLASPAGSYVTGKVIEIDGGLEAGNLSLNLPDL
jgi:7-alpha-hydroxysteroid dehydrogenase